MIAGTYYYATAFNRGETPSSASASFYVRPEAIPPGSDDHSLTEMVVEGNHGRWYEIGIMTDPSWYSNTKQHLFVSSWRNGKFQGLGRDFHSRSSVKPGMIVRDHAYHSFGFKLTRGKVEMTFNHRVIGFYKVSGYRASAVSVFGEVYADGRGLPQMRGVIKNYRTDTGSTLDKPTASYPYRITAPTATGFSFR